MGAQQGGARHADKAAAHYQDWNVIIIHSYLFLVNPIVWARVTAFIAGALGGIDV
ncbi:hypothetical protein GCM10025784_26530 [Citricoccus nitrophenolicus]